jgi:hypothetical protein
MDFEKDRRSGTSPLINHAKGRKGTGGSRRTGIEPMAAYFDRLVNNHLLNFVL